MKLNSLTLLATAREIAARLKPLVGGTTLRIQSPNHVRNTNSDGWCVVIGDLGKGQPQLVLFLDKFSGYPERKLYAGFYSTRREKIIAITDEVSKKLWPIRIVTVEEIVGETQYVLVDRLKKSEFNSPILEDYAEDQIYYGMCDPTRTTTEKVNPQFCNRAVAFFEDVARSLPNAKAGDAQREVYPQCENRKWVTSHLQRERSGLLATECKIRDDYECQVCGLLFQDEYGKLGIDFAEAHHIVPLSKLAGMVKTSLEDLITVCANCHRMLHRMTGNRDDVSKLRAIWKRHRK